MSPTDFRYRVTGITTPVVGSSFDREQRERAIAQDLIDFLEDRAVLFEDDLYEDTESCRDSVFKIREWLETHMPELRSDSRLKVDYFQPMQEACRTFIGAVGRRGPGEPPLTMRELTGRLFEMRHTFGDLFADMKPAYELHVGPNLASIVPGEASS